MNGKFTLYMDQYGNHWYAKSAKELRAKIGGGRISTMYCDKLGGPVKIGYIIGKHWCEAFQPIEKPVHKR